LGKIKEEEQLADNDIMKVKSSYIGDDQNSIGMSILDTIGQMFSKSNEGPSEFGWHGISTEQQFDDVVKSSNQKPQVIYKHSPRCAISYLALKNVESLPSTDKEKADFHMVDVVGQRPISMHISDTLSIRHESPQLFIIKDGEIIWHGSHHQVKSEVITKNL
jgi:bacillithiol system protein YtxJ